MAKRIRKGTGTSTRVEHTRHIESERVNIPTAELEAFAGEDEQQPKKVLYPRNPDLDPQLVWKGKDEQDQHPLEVPSVPIYIQEHISPKALIEDLRAVSAGRREQQMDLFGDFTGMELEERVEFYQHAMRWSNRMILGDSLLVMTSLAEKEGLKGQVQMIYVDPPYGIKFGSNWQVSTRKRDVKDGKLDDATRQPEQVKAFRDTWALGIHSYLNYLRDRFVVARDLLTDSGSIFVQIGDENVHLVRGVLDEVFGADNFAAQVVIQTTSSAGSRMGNVTVQGVHDYVVWYAKVFSQLKFRPLYVAQELGESVPDYRWARMPDGSDVRVGVDGQAEAIANGGRLWARRDATSAGAQRTGNQPVEVDGREFRPAPGSHWKTTHELGMARLKWADRLVPSAGKTLSYRRYLDDFPYRVLNNVWTDAGSATNKVYAVQTSPRVIQRCLLMTTDPGELVLDPTLGSGTTAAVAEQWGRRWIGIDTSRVSLALARTRVMSSRFAHYMLADSPAGIAKLGLAVADQGDASPKRDMRKGFVYHTTPHVSLGDVANNPEIIEAIAPEDVDRTIRKHATHEALLDRPVEERGVVRVAGPFTVESLSPHRVMTDAAGDGDGQSPEPVEDQARFIDMVLDNLRRAGVQNQVKDQRLQFEALDRFAGRAIQAEGFYQEGGERKRAAVAIGPQYGTVGIALVREAAKEAAGWFELLIVTGFAFDARADELKQLGNLPIVAARMNADLLLGDQLKKTGAGNLFTVFGQPDVELRTLDDGQLQVDIRGIDVYDPTTGEIRSDSPDEIASWFIDTDYNSESFFVRHAYFCGGDRPYERLQKTLKAEIDPEAWETLYSATSRPFPRPESGKIAVKVINHYGDEILKVYNV